jgi:hypothetical protein
MKATSYYVPALVAACFSFKAARLSAQSTFMEGYSARLSWPVVENLIPKRPEIKEFLADGDYVSYVMVYHPAAAELVRRVHPQAVLEENFASPELEVKARQMAAEIMEKNPLWKDSFSGEGIPEGTAQKGQALTEDEKREREAALRHDVAEQKASTDLYSLDAATLQAKLANLKALWHNASDALERTALEREIRLLEKVLHNRKP